MILSLQKVKDIEELLNNGHGTTHILLTLKVELKDLIETIRDERERYSKINKLYCDFVNQMEDHVG